jgi:putative ABC transport system permease protein
MEKSTYDPGPPPPRGSGSVRQYAAGDDGAVVAITINMSPEGLPSLGAISAANYDGKDYAQHTLATLATSLDRLIEACGGNEPGTADVVMVASQEGSGTDAAVADIAKQFPELRVLSNTEAVNRFERGGFTYFRQISTVLTTVTLAFAVLLITVLLTVSINQRLGEIAALRALGFTRWRVVADVFCESVLIVGGGGLLSLPLGAALAAGLDSILKRIPGIPADVHFFVYQPSALQVHLLLLAATAIIAALYPIRVVATLPIAATLRDEVIG